MRPWSDQRHVAVDDIDRRRQVSQSRPPQDLIEHGLAFGWTMQSPAPKRSAMKPDRLFAREQGTAATAADAGEHRQTDRQEEHQDKDRA
jgi:hypothetical protein